MSSYLLVKHWKDRPWKTSRHLTFLTPLLVILDLLYSRLRTEGCCWLEYVWLSGIRNNYSGQSRIPQQIFEDIFPLIVAKGSLRFRLIYLKAADTIAEKTCHFMKPCMQDIVAIQLPHPQATDYAESNIAAPALHDNRYNPQLPKGRIISKRGKASHGPMRRKTWEEGCAWTEPLQHRSYLVRMSINVSQSKRIEIVPCGRVI